MYIRCLHVVRVCASKGAERFHLFAYLLCLLSYLLMTLLTLLVSLQGAQSVAQLHAEVVEPSKRPGVISLQSGNSGTDYLRHPYEPASAPLSVWVVTHARARVKLLPTYPTYLYLTLIPLIARAAILT